MPRLPPFPQPRALDCVSCDVFYRMTTALEKRATPAAVAVRCPEHKKKNKKSREPEVLEIGAPAGGDRHEPAVRHVGAVDEVDVSEVEAPGGDRHEPAVRRASAVAEAEVLEVGAPGGDREPAVRAPGEVEVQRRPLRARRP